MESPFHTYKLRTAVLMLRHQLLGVAVLVFAVLHAHAMPDRRRMEPAVVPGTSDHWVATARATGPVA